MPEAVIVSVARSPIGRAGKGSLVEMRPDDLAAQMVKAALAQVPALDPTTIDDLMLGCGQPAGEGGFNMARVVAVLAGLDSLPGVTVNRYCSSSLQTSRMAFHAIKAGEGQAFVSAGVETVSRFIKGGADFLPDTENPVFAEAVARTASRAAGGAETWSDPRGGGDLPDIYIAMGQTAENVAQMTGITRAEQDEFGVRSQNLAEAAIKPTDSGPAGHRPGHPRPRARSSPPTTAPGAGTSRSRRSPSSSRSSVPTARSRRGTPAPSTTAPPPSSS
jgi:acetyl-CoA C-acetyltransferase